MYHSLQYCRDGHPVADSPFLEHFVHHQNLVHFWCTNSSAEKEVAMDISLALLEDAAPVDISLIAGA